MPRPLPRSRPQGNKQRDTMKQYVVLLATDDSAVEASVKALTAGASCELNCVRTSREVQSIVTDGALDGFWNQDLAVVDLDLDGAGRTLLRTAGGALPVIAVTSQSKPWLSAMLRHKRIRAALTKPVSLDTLSDAFKRVRRVQRAASPGELQTVA